MSEGGQYNIMSVIKGYISEEVERLQEMEKRLLDEIRKFPKGTVQRRILTKSQKCYAYLKFYENGKTMQKYLGRYDSPEVQEIIRKIERRRKYEESLKRIRKDGAFGMKAINVLPASVRIRAMNPVITVSNRED